MTMQRILCPVDGSAHGRRAAELAGTLASLYDAEVLLLHVLEPDRLSEEKSRMVEVEYGIGSKSEQVPSAANLPGELVAMLERPWGKTTQQRALELVAEKVVRTARGLVEEQGVAPERVRVLCKDGRPARAILDTIDEQAADTVVIGSRGLSPAGGMVMGSVSQRVASAAPCTVITVR